MSSKRPRSGELDYAELVAAKRTKGNARASRARGNPLEKFLSLFESDVNSGKSMV